MTDRELMQQALEALELYQSKGSVQMFDDAVKVLRERLEQERKPVAWRKNYQNSGYTYFDERWGTIPNDAEPLFSN